MSECRCVWEFEVGFVAFRKQFAEQYEPLDKACEHFSTAERPVGTLV